jgi:membrane protease YdiL (CAAX protease family)
MGSNSNNRQIVFEDIDGREPPVTTTEKNFSMVYLLVGIAFPVSAWLSFYSIYHRPCIRYRPWIAFPLSVAFYVSIITAMLVYSVYVCKKQGLMPLFRLGPLKKFLKELLHSILLLLLLLFILGITRIFLTLVFQVEVKSPEKWDLVRYAPNSVALFSLLLLGFSFMPIVEEVYFRGFLYNALKSRFTIPIALVIQALVFSSIHGYDLANSFLIFIIGIILAVVYEIKKNLLSPVLMHSMKNAIVLIPVLVLIGMNHHTPSKTWSQAATEPDWLDLSTFEDIDRQENGLHQWQYAIDTWGSVGARRWKREVKAFEAVCYFFPEDREACAKARLGIVVVYSTYLMDYRRAIFQVQQLLQEYTDQREACAEALSRMGWSYYMLRDFNNSRQSFDKVIAEFKECENAFVSAQQGIEWLNSVQPKL